MIKIKNNMNIRNRPLKKIVLLIITLLILLVIIVVFLYPGFFSNPPQYTPKQGFFVSNDGNDSNNGTSPNSPWKTIEKVNFEMKWGVIREGNDVYFRRGDTFIEDDSLYLRGKGGTRNNSMVIGAYGTGANPIISSSGVSPLLYFTNDDTEYWTLENLYLRAPPNCGSFNLIAGNTGDKYNLTIRNCTFDGNNYGSNGHKGNILLYNAHDYLIRDCTFIDASHYLYGKGVGGKPNSNTKMINCTFDGKGGSQDNIQIHCEYDDPTGNAENHLILNVTSTNCTANAFDIVGGWYRQYKCENVYIKNCVGDVIGLDAPIVIGHGVSNVTVENCFFEGPLYLTRSNNTIVRNCVFKDATSGFIISQDDPQWAFGWGTQSCTLYNNDFIVGGGTRFIHTDVGATGPDNLSGFFIKNNIFYSTVSSSPSIFVYYDEKGPGVNNLATTDSNFSYNMWWRGDSNFNNKWVLDDGTYSLMGWNTLDEVENDLANNPNLSNPSGTHFPDDFKLTSGSPCIDAGDWLTRTNGDGSGTTISVLEANYFFPGISSLRVKGDIIFVGNDKNLVVTGVDYTADTITVNRSIIWSNGEAVSLSAYNGLAPDIGAIEFNS
jgi:hypothetical protein